MSKRNVTNSVYSLGFHSDAFTVGGQVAFRRTSGDSICGVSFGTVLAIGAQKSQTSERIEDGAIIAWEDDRYDPQTYPAHVGFQPFWNQRLTAIPANRP